MWIKLAIAVGVIYLFEKQSQASTKEPAIDPNAGKALIEDLGSAWGKFTNFFTSHGSTQESTNTDTAGAGTGVTDAYGDSGDTDGVTVGIKVCTQGNEDNCASGSSPAGFDEGSQ